MTKFINKISEKLVKMLLQYDVITEDDYEIYMFGVFQNIVLIINLLTSFFIFALAGLIAEGLLFSVFYSLLRSYAGGYHSKSLLVCYVLSVLITTLVAYISYIVDVNYFTLVIYITSFILIWWLAPVDTHNKRLDKIEKRIYMQKSRCVLICIIIFAVCFFIFNYSQGIIVLSFAMIIETAMIIAGKLDNYLDNQKGKIV